MPPIPLSRLGSKISVRPFRVRILTRICHFPRRPVTNGFAFRPLRLASAMTQADRSSQSPCPRSRISGMVCHRSAPDSFRSRRYCIGARANDGVFGCFAKYAIFARASVSTADSMACLASSPRDGRASPISIVLINAYATVTTQRVPTAI